MRKNRAPSTKPTASGMVMAASLSAAAAQLDCAPSVLKRAKKAGAPGFRPNGSVCISELKTWLQKHSEDVDGTSSQKEELECRRLVAQCEKLEFQNEVEKGLYTHNDKLREQGRRIGGATRSELMRFKADCPTWEGLTAVEIERRVDALIDLICRNLNSATERVYQ
jgi:hypothetical protein